jgi:hypothetical protein
MATISMACERLVTQAHEYLVLYYTCSAAAISGWLVTQILCGKPPTAAVLLLAGVSIAILLACGDRSFF